LLVRFADGFEASLDQSDVEVRDRFADELPAGFGTSSFDLERFVILRSTVGSRAQGLEGDDSDTDVRGVYLAPADWQWSLYGAPEQFEDHAAQSCCWELQKFLSLALKARPNVLEVLYSPLVTRQTELGAELMALRGAFLSRRIYYTFHGYAVSQFDKIERDIRERGEVRWRHAMHLLRLLISGATALREGRITVQVGSFRERLLQVKAGQMSWEDIKDWRRDLHADFDRALRESTLPEYPDYAAANRFLIRARRWMAVHTMPQTDVVP
jgi:predicted nucleotidyltransferase